MAEKLRLHTYKVAKEVLKTSMIGFGGMGGIGGGGLGGGGFGGGGLGGGGLGGGGLGLGRRELDENQDITE